MFLSGYVDGELFVTYFHNLFISNFGQERPVPLLMDNLDSHMSLLVVDLARANQAIFSTFCYTSQPFVIMYMFNPTICNDA